MPFGLLHLLATLSLSLTAVALAPERACGESQPPLVAVGSPESRLLADAADGSFDRGSFVRAALIAGGIRDSQELHAWQTRFDVLCQPLDFRREAGEALSAAALFEFLHAEILTGDYNAAVTTLPATLRTGDYNCLTATTLLVALGDRYAVPLEAVSTSGHIYCRHFGPTPLDIETTCPDWSQATSLSTGSGRSAGRFAASRSIDRVQIVAKIYYNRGLALLADKQFAAATALLERSRQLDPYDADARENLLAGFNNWALSLAQAEQFADAAKLLVRGKEIDANYPPLAANQLHIHQRWAAWHCSRHEYEAALAVLEQGRRLQPEAPLFVAGPQAVYAEWIGWLRRQGADQQAAEVLAAARRRLDRRSLEKLQARVQYALGEERSLD